MLSIEQSEFALIKNMKRKRNNHEYIVGTTGQGRELKTVKIWCEKEFGLKVPEELNNDTQLYTHSEVWEILDRVGMDNYSAALTSGAAVESIS